MDHKTLKDMERVVLEEADVGQRQALEAALADQPEALARVRALEDIVADLRRAPDIQAPHDMAGRVVERIEAEAARQAGLASHASCRGCALLFGAAGGLYLLLGGAALLVTRHMGPLARQAPALAGQPLVAVTAGLILLVLAALILARGPAMLCLAMAGAWLHGLAAAADGLILLQAAPIPVVAAAALAMAWTGLVTGALLADAARQALRLPPRGLLPGQGNLLPGQGKMLHGQENLLHGQGDPT